MATKLHKDLTGADLHPNAIDGTTGTELTVASQTTYDTRYVRTIGETITPTGNGSSVLKITKADGITIVLSVDTINSSLLFPTNGNALNFGGNSVLINQSNATF